MNCNTILKPGYGRFFTQIKAGSMPAYQQRLEDMNIVQSMSRKGNCHDNAPIESFFNLMKRECLNRYRIDDLTSLRKLVDGYVDWFNNARVSRTQNGLTPVEYREQTMIG